MIYRICNHNNEHFIDTFYKVAIIVKKYLPYFNHLTSDNNLIEILQNIKDSDQVLITDLLPKNIKVNILNKLNNSGILSKNNIDFLITPQDKKLKKILETFQNKEVVVLLYKNQITHLVGTHENPLKFIYKPFNSSDPKVIKGYSINIKGDCLGTEKLFENIKFSIYPRGLAFKLAQEL